MILILEVAISSFLMSQKVCFPLFPGYVARYAPSKNNKTFYF